MAFKYLIRRLDSAEGGTSDLEDSSTARIQLKHEENQNPRTVNSISQLNIIKVPER